MQDSTLQLVDRNNPCFWSKTNTLFNSNQIEKFVKRGCLELKKSLSEASTQTLIKLSEKALNYRGPGLILENDHKTPRSIFNFHQIFPQVEDLIRQQKHIISYAEEILGSKVYIYQCHLNYKSPFVGGNFYWHSDFTFWHWEDGMPNPRALSIVLLLDSMSSTNGPLFYISGSHLFLTHSQWAREYSSAHEEQIKHQTGRNLFQEGLVAPEQLNILFNQKKLTMDSFVGVPGDILIMDANLIHASSNNFSPYPRKALFLILNSVENTPGAPFNGRPHRPSYITHTIGTPL